VIYNSRRWWYQPQALERERSGLTDSPGIWFLKGILRSHAYDEKTLELLVGKQVSPSSWKIGDMVAPKKLKSMNNSEELSSHGVDEAIGRIVHESSASGPFPARMRGSGSVNVVFVSKTFAESTSLQTGASFKEKSIALESRKVSISRLIHTSAFHGLTASQKPRKGTKVKTRAIEDDDEVNDSDDMSDRLSSDFQRLRILNVPAIDRITKECDRTSTSLVALFEAGLPRFVLQALDHVMKNIQISKNDESLAQAISALGKLALRVTEKSFPNECCASTIHIQSEKGKENQHRTTSEELHSSNATSNENNSPLDQERSSENLDVPSEDRSGRMNRSSSLIQRRRMLLSLMSRARRSGGDSLGDIISREMNVLPSLEMNADGTEAFFFSPPGTGNNFDDNSSRQDDGRLENSRPNECTSSVEDKLAAKCSFKETILDIVFRGRNDEKPTSGINGVIPLVSIKNIVSMGILGNSLPWLKAFLNCFAKKIARKSSTSEFPILKHAFDDDGMPLLQLAISLGCCKTVVEELIRYGAPVTDNELQLAADVDLPEILSVLLMHQVYSDGIIDLEKCSPAIAEVILHAKKRQDAQYKNLRVQADSFLVSFTQKLIQISLTRRQQQQQNGNDILGRTIACSLVGNTELCAFRRGKKQMRPGDVLETDFEDSAISDINVSGMDSCGLLQVLPSAIFGRSLSEEPSYLTNLLLLIEDFLCSKGINDGCVGLTLLLTLLQRFPLLNQSIEMERYGFAELVDSHAALSLNRLTEISSRIAKRNICGRSSNEPVFSASEVIFCPKKHIATIHVTKHSSFRCDLCGVGVKCGAIMHGCRECDWDACESCTDKVEGGIVKWKFVKELSSKCQQLLAQKKSREAGISEEEDGRWAIRMVEGLKQLDNTSDANTLSIRLLQRDPDAIQGLAYMLKEKGRVTMHQFLMVILPALHSSLMGKSLSNEHSSTRRRTKKPRVAGIQSRESEGSIDTREEERLQFAKEILKSLVNDSSTDNQSMSPQEEEQNDNLMEDDDGDFVANNDSFEENSEINISPKSERVLGKQLPELLRRLHQVLALHEDVRTLNIAHFNNKNDVSPGNLRSLKELIKLRLRQQTSIGSQMQSLDEATRDVTIFSEPLVSVRDLSHQILKTASTTHPEYSAFCKKLVDDSAIILERPISSSENEWRIAKIVSYNEKTGCHGMNYASGFARESMNTDASFDLTHGDDFPPLEYEADITKLILSLRKYVVIYRDKNSDKKSAFDMDQLLAEGMVGQSEESSKNRLNVIGTIVESDFKPPSWATYTIVGVDYSEKNEKYDILSEDGQVFCGVPANRINGIDVIIQKDTAVRGSEYRFPRLNSASRQSIDSQGHFSRAYPFLMSGSRRQATEGEISNSSGKGQRKLGKHSLKRTWSALALIESMCPVGVSATSKFDQQNPLKSDRLNYRCSVGCRNVVIYVDRKLLEISPSFQIRFSSPQLLGAMSASATEETTLVSLLHELNQGEMIDFFREEGHQILYSLIFKPSTNEERINDVIVKKRPIPLNSKSSTSCGAYDDRMDIEMKPNDELVHKKIWANNDQSIKLTDTPNFLDSDELGPRCADLDEICIQCMEILEFLARVNTRFAIDKNENGFVFVNEDLSQKLSKQTEDPLFVVGGIIPDWCLSIPAFTPNMYVPMPTHLFFRYLFFNLHVDNF
jgi:hypothetical protein